MQVCSHLIAEGTLFHCTALVLMESHAPRGEFDQRSCIAAGLVRLIQPFSMQITLPADAAEQRSRVRLPLVPCDQPQARLDGLALGLRAGDRHRLGEERIVNLDAGSDRNVIEV
jgi:hypothetical protein